jgi:hypothetical protein
LKTSDRGGIEVQSFNPSHANPVFSGDSASIVLTMEDIGRDIAVLENDGPDGNPRTDNYYEPRLPVAVMGCPFCGCTNLP